MAYAEFLRARRSLTWHLGILAAITLLALYFAHDTSVTVDGSTHLLSGTPLPLGKLAPIAMFFAMIYASSAGTSLNRESGVREISWTKPIPRTLLAFEFVLIDVAAIVLVFALSLLAVILVLLRLHIAPVLDAGLVSDLALGLGVAVMWYALVQVLSFAFGGGARSIGGILWPIAFVDLGLTEVPGALGAFARGLEFLNPLAYAAGISSGKSGDTPQIALPADTRALMVWLIAAAACAFAIALWPKKEA